jgi:hypothetical protein
MLVAKAMKDYTSDRVFADRFSEVWIGLQNLPDQQRGSEFYNKKSAKMVLINKKDQENVTVKIAEFT